MRFAIPAALSSLLLVTACDTSGFDPFATGPSRPQIDVAKEVTMVSGAELVGTWSCRELNPYPDQPVVTTNLVLNADGSFVSEALLPVAETVPGASDMVMTTAGDWQVEGDRFVTQEAEVDVVAADGEEDAMASWMDTAAEFFMERAGDANAEIFRVTASEFVMRDEDPDAPTISCMRQA